MDPTPLYDQVLFTIKVGHAVTVLVILIGVVGVYLDIKFNSRR